MAFAVNGSKEARLTVAAGSANVCSHLSFKNLHHVHRFKTVYFTIKNNESIFLNCKA
jgi:hypothetical protein